MAFFIVLLAAGCSTASDSTKVNHTKIVAPIDYGNGVYYFSTGGAQFGNSLSDFIENHPELEIVAITGDGNGGYGSDMGYFVVFSKQY